MLKQLFPDMKGKGTYKTFAGARTKAEAELSQMEEEFRYIIVANEEGRFFPVIQLTKDQQWMAGMIAHRGMGVML